MTKIQKARFAIFSILNLVLIFKGFLFSARIAHLDSIKHRRGIRKEISRLTKNFETLVEKLEAKMRKSWLTRSFVDEIINKKPRKS